eukprot:668587-Ditylum_brightwellii.AAC.1
MDYNTSSLGPKCKRTAIRVDLSSSDSESDYNESSDDSAPPPHAESKQKKVNLWGGTYLSMKCSRRGSIITAFLINSSILVMVIFLCTWTTQSCTSFSPHTLTSIIVLFANGLELRPQGRWKSALHVMLLCVFSATRPSSIPPPYQNQGRPEGTLSRGVK